MFDVANLKMPTVTRMVGSHCSYLSSLLDVADLNSANSHKDGGGWVTTQATVIVFDVGDIEHANNNEDGACPPPPPPQGKRGNHPNHRGRGKELTDLNKSSLLNCYRRQTIPYQRCVHQQDSSLLQSDSNCNYVENPPTPQGAGQKT